MEAPPPIKNTLAIALQPSFIASKKFVEYISHHELEQLIKSDCIQNEWDNGNYSQKIASQSYANEREQLKSYLANYNKNLQAINVRYNKPNHKWGRVFPYKSLGLTSLIKKTRNTLIHNTYYDYDLSNAQPEIVRNLCLQNNIPCEIISKYCNERETIIADLITASNNMATRDDVKKLMIRLSFFGTFKGWLEEFKITPFDEPTIITQYVTEIRKIANVFIANNPEMYETIKKLKTAKNEKNVIGAFFSTYLQEIELRLVEKALMYIDDHTDICKKIGNKYLPLNTLVATYEFDGIKLLKANVDNFLDSEGGGNERILQLLNVTLTDAGFDMAFEIKPITKIYDIEFIPPPPPPDKKDLAEQKKADKKRLKDEAEAECAFKHLEERRELLNDKANLIAQTDLEACEIIYEKVKDKLIYEDDVLYYKSGYYWIDSIKDIKAHLGNFIINSGIKQLNDRNEKKPFVQNNHSCEAVLSALLKKVYEKNVKNGWVANMYKSSLGKILFTNGYYDFKKTKFFAFADKDYDHSVIFVVHLSYPYVIPQEPSFKEYVTSVKKRLFIDPFDEKMANYYILNLARGLAGDAMKRIIMAVGASDTGKSTITNAMNIVCGKYMGTFNGNNLIVKKFANNDDAQALRWILLLKACRIIVSNEISNEAYINGEILKKLASGGRDKIVARIHGGYEQEFNISFLPIIFANDIEKIKPMDDAIMTRVRSLSYMKKYVPNPSNEYELQMDKNLDGEILTMNFRYAFLSLLIEAYAAFMLTGNDLEDTVANETKEAFEDTFEESEDLIPQFKKDFKFTDDKEEFTANSVIEEWIKKTKQGVTISKFTRELKRYVAINKINNKVVYNGNKGKHRGWFGVRKLGDDEDD